MKAESVLIAVGTTYMLVELIGVAAKPCAGFNTQNSSEMGQHKFYDYDDAKSGTV